MNLNGIKETFTRKEKPGMTQKSPIEWTDVTWNPGTGCTKVGPGYDHCYAERFAERWRGIRSHPYDRGLTCGCDLPASIIRNNGKNLG